MVMRAVYFTQAVAGAAFRRNGINQAAFRTFSRPVTTMCTRSQQAQSQPTYGDVFNAQGNIRDKPITPEDAARMRSGESSILGQTVKGGTAAKMQSAVDKSANGDATSPLPTLDELVTPNVDIDVTATSPLPTLDELVTPNMDIDDPVGPPTTGRVDVVDHPITIGEALEAAGETIGDKPVDEVDARIIQSAESRATGNAPGVKRVVAAEAQVAANMNAAGSLDGIPTVHDVLSHAKEKMQVDKVVTHEDAARVQAAEMRNAGGTERKGGIAATMQSAADKNAASDFEPREGQAGRIPNQ